MSTWANLEYPAIQLVMKLLQIVRGLHTTSTVVCTAMFPWYWWPYNQCSLHFAAQEVETICTKTAACNEWMWSRLSNGIFWVADAHILLSSFFGLLKALVNWMALSLLPKTTHDRTLSSWSTSDQYGAVIFPKDWPGHKCNKCHLMTSSGREHCNCTIHQRFVKSFFLSALWCSALSIHWQE